MSWLPDFCYEDGVGCICGFCEMTAEEEQLLEDYYLVLSLQRQLFKRVF